MSVSEYWDKYRVKAALAGAGQHLAADFRSVRVTRRGVIKWTLTVVLAFLFAALVTLYFLDWNQMRGPLGHYLSRRTGREVRIDGNLNVDLFTLQPRIDAG